MKINIIREMLKNALKSLVYVLFLKIFYGKMIKQLIMLTTFYIFYKVDIKTFLIWFINNCHKTTFNIIHIINLT